MRRGDQRANLRTTRIDAMRLVITICAATLLTVTGFAARAATIVLGPAQYSLEAITNAGSGATPQDNEQTSAGQVTANSVGANGMSDALSWATHNQFVSASGSVSEQAGRQLQAFGGVAQTSVSCSFERAAWRPLRAREAGAAISTLSRRGHQARQRIFSICRFAAERAVSTT